VIQGKNDFGIRNSGKTAKNAIFSGNDFGIRNSGKTAKNAIFSG